MIFVEECECVKMYLIDTERKEILILQCLGKGAAVLKGGEAATDLPYLAPIQIQPTCRSSTDL